MAWAAKDDLTLVSRVSGANGAGADAASYFPSVSGDGRYVAFTSYANNLSGEDVDATYDVFVRDLQTNVLTLASRATGAAGAAGTDGSSDASISADGRYVAFSSVADNLSAEDDNLSTNVFVRDLQANTTTLVTRASGAAGAGASDPAYDGRISANGRYVTFISSADNLSAEDNNSYINVFVRDLQANTTTLVSRAAGAAGTGADDSSYNPSVSADGRYVAFQSNADNLSADDNNTYTNLFVRDLQANTLTLVSRASGAAGTHRGRRLLHALDLRRRSLRELHLERRQPQRRRQQRVREHLRPRPHREHDHAGEPGRRRKRRGRRGHLGRLVHLGDGRRVGFTSGANNLSAEDNNGYDNIFVRDLVNDTLTFTSRAAGAVGPRGTGTRRRRRSPRPAATWPSRRTPTTSATTTTTPTTNLFLRDLGPIPGGGGGGGGGNDATKPRVSRVGMSRKRFKVGKKRTPVSAAVKAGTRFRYTLSEESTVRITIERALPGRRARKRSGPCRAPSDRRAKNRKCTRYRRSGTLVRRGEGPGRDSTAFSGRIGRKALKPGKYRATFRATDAAGNRSSAKRIGFTDRQALERPGTNGHLPRPTRAVSVRPCPLARGGRVGSPRWRRAECSSASSQPSPGQRRTTRRS